MNGAKTLRYYLFRGKVVDDLTLLHDIIQYYP